MRGAFSRRGDARKRGALTHRVEVYGSDFGQVLHMDAIEGMRVLLRALLGFGIKPEEVKLMRKDNLAKLMCLDD